MTRSGHFSRPLIFAFVAVVGTTPYVAFAGTAINIEGVGEYPDAGTGTACDVDLPYAWPDVTQFKNVMLNPSTNFAGYTNGQSWKDGSVWPTDFTDDVSGGSDNLYFDKVGSAISYVHAHGTLPGGPAVAISCTTGANCQQPIAGCHPSYAKFCRNEIGMATGWCGCTSFDRTIVTYSNGNCGFANYSGGTVKWGESGNSGGWAGAGTNGGTNVAVVVISFAQNAMRGHELFPAYAGVHMILTPLNHTGDTGDHPDRGFWFAYQYYVNPAKSVMQSWLDGGPPMSCTNSPTTSCGWGSQWQSCGYGINGCGGHIGMALDSTASTSLGHVNEDWYGAQQDWRDAKGTQYWNNLYQCNWDCAATGFVR